MIKRYSSRRKKLDQSFLNEKLKDAKSYERIAGYFASSIFEVSGEALENIEGVIRIICNSSIEVEDVKTANLANNNIRKEWCDFKPEDKFSNSPKRLKKLYDLLKSGKLQIKVIPNDIFGLVHGKAGVITLKDGSKTSFMGSVNETLSGWKLNYEILWEDDSQEAINWVQEEFDFFWNSPYAIPLTEFIITDIKRISERDIITSVDFWKNNPDPASIVIESPVYRQEVGLWEHQKYFVSLAFNEHKKPHGARLVLADMVGLGKTIQLALSAQLMALYGNKPILIIAPKTLLWQWQEEINNLLEMPSAVWNGKDWIDENGIRYPSVDEKSIMKCPRKVGIISQGLITSGSNTISSLLTMEYECVIVDESHRARRKNLGVGKENQKADPNNLLKFLLEISKKTKSMLLATATPVQLYPIEAWDLLNVLSQNNENVLGTVWSHWRKFAQDGLDLIMGKTQFKSNKDYWDWLRDPFPPKNNDDTRNPFNRLREELDLKDNEFFIKSEVYDNTDRRIQYKLEKIIEDNILSKNNPFINHIVRRTRDSLEKQINTETGEPYLKKISVKLFGEKDAESIVLPPYLQEAYNHAEDFSNLLKQRISSGGFIKTLLLKRVGSTMIAGENTARKMLKNWAGISSDIDFEDETDDDDTDSDKGIKDLTEAEIQCLKNFVSNLEENKDKDPKYQLTLDLLIKEKWKDRGCIIFSQFYDSILWLAENLSQNLPNEKFGIYAGGDKSGIMEGGIFKKHTKEKIKQLVKSKEIKILLGTDAASEGLNLQTLGTLINLDLPWNPTRLEQRKGRIQRIGQIYDEIFIYNMRYKDSVEDKVHSILSQRLESIHSMFGQIPDILEDVWIDIALNNIEEAKKKIDAIPKKHPFYEKYDGVIKKLDWDNCNLVLDSNEKKKYLMSGW